MATLLAAYLLSLILRPAGSSIVAVDGWGVDVFEIIAGALCLARARFDRRRRTIILAFGCAVLCWAFGDVALTIESLGGATPPVPSVADGFYLAFYPLTYVGVVQYMRSEMRKTESSSWFDGLIAAFGAAAVCATFAFHAIVRSTGGSNLSVATNLAYPIGDLLLLAMVAGGSVLLSGRRRPAWIVLAAGMAVNVVGDTVNLFGSSVGSTKVGTVANGIAWPAAILLMSMSVWIDGRSTGRVHDERPTRFLLPGVGAAAGLAILFAATIGRPGPVAVGLATATLVVVGARVGLSARGLRALTEERHRQSITDELTGLSNRRHLSNLLEAYFGDPTVGVEPTNELAFLFIDLNHFKEINDTFGHPAGDQLLQQLGARLSTALRPGDALVRLGGDEFAALLYEANGVEAVATADRLAACLVEPFALDAVTTQISASVGIALAPSDATDSTALIWCADVAMYRAKLGGVPYALYDQALDDRASQMSLAEDLNLAFEHDQFVLHYQPQMDLNRGQITGVEALVRWVHPALGLVPPLKFVPLAEEAGLMSRLTSWVLTEAVAQAARWRAAGQPLTVAVNISPSNLREMGFAEFVHALLTWNELPAASLVLEITETTVLDDFDRCVETIEQLRRIGVTISIDDFGAGFTSLAHLADLPVGELKLDRSFIVGLGDQEDRNLQLVRATVDLAHSMGLRVVAEGIEDAATLRILEDIGCDMAQGYFIAPPRPADLLKFRTPGVDPAGPSDDLPLVSTFRPGVGRTVEGEKLATRR